MNALAVVPEETTTQTEEKIFIQGLPVLFKEQEADPLQATYNYKYGYGNSHNIILSDGKERVARTSELTPARPLTDAEMVVYLTEQLYEASKSADTYKKAYHSSDEDIERIAAALSEEAENRGWCEEYSRFCDDVNSTLVTGSRLQPLEREFEIDIEIEATITATRTVTVTARSLEEAEGYINDDPESFFDLETEVCDAASMGVTDYTVNII